MFQKIDAEIFINKIQAILRNNYVLVFIVAILLSGCNRPIRNESDYLKWLNDPSNGVVKTKHVSGFDIKVKFMPPSYLFSHDISSESSIPQRQKDSIYNIYKNSITFMLTLGPDEGDSNKSSVMYYGVRTYKDYVKRDLIMNFDFKQYVHIEADGEKYDPVLSTMENSYELGLGRNILFVFVPHDKTDTKLFTADKLDFTYDDNLFELGLNHFVFKQKSLQNIPAYPELTMN